MTIKSFLNAYYQPKFYKKPHTKRKNETHTHTDKNEQFDEEKKCIDNLVKVSTFYDVTQLQIEMKNLFKWHIF